MTDPVSNPADLTSGSLSSLVLTALNAAVTPERVAALVEVHVNKLVKEAIEGAFHSWSPTGKTITAAIGESLQVKDLNLPSYGHTVSEILGRQIQATVSDTVAAKLTKDMENLLKLAPKRVKLSELVKELLGEEDHRVYCKVEPSDDNGSWAKLMLSKEEPTKYKDADIQLHIHLTKKWSEYKDNETIEGTISFGKVSGSDLKKDVRFGYGTEYPKQKTEFGRWFGLEQQILSMYAVGTVIELDENDVQTSREDD